MDKIKIPTKKAQEYPKIITWVIIGIFVLAIFLMLLDRIMKGTSEYIDDETCKKSVAANANARIKIKGTDVSSYIGKIVPIKCSTNYETVESGDEKEMKRALADSMAKCWDYFGKEGYELFDTKDGNYCVICSRMEFKKPKRLDEFSKFLIEENYGSETYFKYFYGKDVPEGFSYDTSDISLREYDSMDTSKPLGIVFMMAKNAHFGKIETTGMGAVGGVAAGGALVVGLGLTSTGLLAWVGIPLVVVTTYIGGRAGYALGPDKSSTFKSRIVVVPYEDIRSLNCTRLEGKAHGLEVTE